MLHAMKREELRREIQIGIDQADGGELLDGEEVFEKLRTKVRAGRERAIQMKRYRLTQRASRVLMKSPFISR